MRRLALMSCALLLSGCGFGHFLGDTVTLPDGNPNAPAGDALNMMRVRAQRVEVVPLLPEGGNVWPPPAGPEPTLEDIQREQNAQNAKLQANAPPPPKLPFSVPAPTQPGGRSQPATPPPPGGAGSTVLLPNGQGTVTGGTSTYRTLNGPSGNGSIVIPNGNGTSTVIGPNGAVSTIPTPR